MKRSELKNLIRRVVKEQLSKEKKPLDIEDPESIPQKSVSEPKPKSKPTPKPTSKPTPKKPEGYEDDDGKLDPGKGPKRRGCMDPECENYDEFAQIDDGSCTGCPEPEIEECCEELEELGNAYLAVEYQYNANMVIHNYVKKLYIMDFTFIDMLLTDQEDVLSGDAEIDLFWAVPVTDPEMQEIYANSPFYEENNPDWDTPIVWINYTTFVDPDYDPDDPSTWVPMEGQGNWIMSGVMLGDMQAHYHIQNIQFTFKDGTIGSCVGATSSGYQNCSLGIQPIPDGSLTLEDGTQLQLQDAIDNYNEEGNQLGAGILDLAMIIDAINGYAGSDVDFQLNDTATALMPYTFYTDYWPLGAMNSWNTKVSNVLNNEALPISSQQMTNLFTDSLATYAEYFDLYMTGCCVNHTAREQAIKAPASFTPPTFDVPSVDPNFSMPSYMPDSF